MANRFDFLPADVLIFLDSSVISKQVDKHHNFADEAYRIKDLTERLSCMDNWVAIPQVIEEQARNVDKSRGIYSKRKKFHRHFEDYLRLMKKLTKLRNFLNSQMENSQVLTPQLAERARAMYPEIKESFYRNDGKTNDLETDIHILTNALAYAQINQNQDREIKACVWSYDHSIIKTLNNVATRLEIPIGRLFETRLGIIPIYGVLKYPDVAVQAAST